jgi:glycosyltransferase involved in cell wall biosynthesis
MIKIAYIIDTIATPNAGTEKQLLMLLKGLDRNFFSPYLVCLRPSEWLKDKSFSFPIEYLNLGSLIGAGLPSALSKYAKFHKANRIDIVQTFFVDANIFGVIAARLAGCKIIISSRRNIGHSYNLLHIVLLRMLRYWTGYYLANSAAASLITQNLEKVSQGRIEVIYNGLELDEFRDIDNGLRNSWRQKWNIVPDEVLIGAVSNLREVKNIKSLIRVAERLKKRFNGIKFAVVGEGPDRQSLQNEIDNRGLTDCFHLVGRHENVLSCLAAFDIAVLCSKYESFSNSLIEYMAAGLPIVASDVGGNSEAIIDGQSGLLYNVDNDDELYCKLISLIENKALASHLRDNARKRAFNNYSRQSYIRNHEEYYRKLYSWQRQG